MQETQQIGENVLAGLLTADIQKKLAAEKLRFQEITEGIRKEYGDWLTDYDAKLVYDARRQNSICAQCKGLPCPKTVNKNFRQFVKTPDENHVIYVINQPCQFILPVWRQNKLQKMFKCAEIPAQYVGKTFEDYAVDDDNRLAVKFAHKLLEEVKMGAYFFGNYGTGKTLLAAIMAQEHIKRGRAVLFSKLPDILRNIRATFNSDKLSDIDILEKLYQVPILVIDDVKATRQKKFAGETLFDIIDARSNAGLQTIMTSNDSLEELADALDRPLDAEKSNDGSRIIDRCKQMCLPVKLGGTSRR